MKFKTSYLVFVAFACLLVYLLANHFWDAGKNKNKNTFQVLVTTQTVNTRDIHDRVEALGTTTANEAVQISATVTAKIQQVHFEDGQHVKQGAVLVELDAGQQRADVEEQRVNLAEEQRQYDHLLKLIDRKAVSQTDVDRQKSIVQAAKAKWEASRAQLQDYTIRAPFSGVLGVRKVSVGTLVSPGTVITTLDDLSRLKVDFSVPEIFLPYLKEGLTIQATSQTYPGKIFEGSINFVDSRIDPATRSINLRAYLPQSDDSSPDNQNINLRPGMLIKVLIEQPPRQALMVPERSIAPLRDDQFAYVVDEAGIAHKRAVQLGQRIGSEVEIISGVNNGEILVIDGSMMVQDGMAVSIKTPNMILSDLSIKRPVLATVMSLIVVIFGIIAFRELPLRGYPDTDPPVVSVETRYPGASANVVESKITQLLEDQLAGVEGLRVIGSESREGRSQINMEFSINRNIDAAASDVREAVSRVLDRLPEDAKPPQVNKSDADSSVIVWFTASSAQLSQLELSDYVDRHIADRFKVIDGASRVQIWGERRYVMRITLDSAAMAARGISANQIEQTLRAENVELPAGKIESADREFAIRVARPYNTPEEFGDMVVARGKSSNIQTGKTPEGHLVRLKEVANIELAAHEERSLFRGVLHKDSPGENMVGIGIVKQSSANTVDVVRSARKIAAEMQKTLPGDIKLQVAFDTAVFLERSVEEVYITIGFSLCLVILVIYIFLGSWRATLIPAITVPVSMAGACIAAWILGFSINILTLMACVLAIGLVVDDAIVVLENIHRRIEKGEKPLLAALHGSREVAFAVIATALVLMAVFAPIVLMEGNISRLFSEFSLTLAAAVACSAFVALTLCAMMSSRLLQDNATHPSTPTWFERGFQHCEHFYHQKITVLTHKPITAIVVLLLSATLVWLYFEKIPREFDPGEDRGIFLLIIQAPEGASFEYTKNISRQVEERMQAQMADGAIDHMLFRIPGFKGSVNSGLGLIMLAPWDERDKTADDIMKETQIKLADIPGVLIYSFMRKPLAAASGQPLEIVIEGDTYEELSEWSNTLLKAAYENPRILRPVVDLKETQPQLHVRIDRQRAADLGVSVSNIGRTLETMLGEREVTTFMQRGEEYDVLLKGDESQFNSKADLQNIYVRSDSSGEAVPLSNLVFVEEAAGAAFLTRYNRMRSFTLSAGLEPDYALSDALGYMQQAVKEYLPAHAHIDYKGLTLEYVRSGSSIAWVIAIALVMVYLVLAAQFESFVHPFIILLTVPFALLGALIALDVMGMTINVYSQIAMIMLIGLAAKNGILMVEFANQLRDRGMPCVEAIQSAAVQRLRPIIMTSLTAAIGTLPLIFSSGAGATSRLIVGVVVCAGVILSTAMTLFIVPAMYALLAKNTGTPKAVENKIKALEASY